MNLLILLFWLLLPPILFCVVLLLRLGRHISFKHLLLSSSILFLVWSPVAGSLFGAWPAYAILGDREVRHTVILKPYRVSFVEEPGVMEHSRYFEIVRNDGKTAYVDIDGDANKCRFSYTKQIEQRIYVMCRGDDVAKNASYIDTKAYSVYSGWSRTSTAIDTLVFR